MFRITDTIKHLMIINVLVFVASQMYSSFMHPLLSLWFPLNGNFGWWQFVSYMFMHGDVSHIFWNMLVLLMFGASLEMEWGKEKFLFFFFSAGIGAALVQSGVNYYRFTEGIHMLGELGIAKYEVVDLLAKGRYNPNWYNIIPYNVAENMIGNYVGPTLGASGATSGIMAAFAFRYPNMRLFPIPLKAKYFVPLMFAGDIFYGFSGQSHGIAYFAHIGGALFGLFMVWYWKRNQFNNNRWN